MAALRNRVAAEGWNDEILEEITDVLDEAAQRILGAGNGWALALRARGGLGRGGRCRLGRRSRCGLGHGGAAHRRPGGHDGQRQRQPGAPRAVRRRQSKAVHASA